MQSILSQENRSLLSTYARANVLIGLGYDGTLAPIVTDPASARMRRRTRQLLTTLSTLFPCVIISGRARAELVTRFSDTRVAALIGNHGAEPYAPPETRARIECWRDLLERQLGAQPGIWIEDKGFSLAIHYRASSSRARARHAILTAAGELEARVVAGKFVINILLPDAPNKGDALLRERARLGCDTSIYLGGDATDEDVFQLDAGHRSLGIRVGDHAASAAPYGLPAQSTVDLFLRALVDVGKERNHS